MLNASILPCFHWFLWILSHVSVTWLFHLLSHMIICRDILFCMWTLVWATLYWDISPTLCLSSAELITPCFIQYVPRLTHYVSFLCAFFSYPVDDLDTSLTESQFLCHVLANGVFPTMSITDAHCYGSAASISKKQLWDLFSLDKWVNIKYNLIM